MKSLTLAIEKGSTVKRYTAVVVSVLGKKVTVKLQATGSVLQGLPYIGPEPATTDTVEIDYASGTPMVYTS